MGNTRVWKHPGLASLKNRYCPKGVFGKGVGNSQSASEMRQKCVRNASKWVLFYWEKRNVQNASEIRQNCVKNASKMRGTPLGENTFWTIPKKALRKALGPPFGQAGSRVYQKHVRAFRRTLTKFGEVCRTHKPYSREPP